MTGRTDLDAARPDDGDDPDALGAAATLPARRSRSDEARETAQRRDRDPEPDSHHGPVFVFEPGARATSRPVQYLRDLWARRQFLEALAKTDLRGGRSSTVLGSIWGVLDPIFQAVLYYFLFIVIRGGQGRPVEFLPLLIGGIFLFRLVLSALNGGGRSIHRSSALMLKSNFPRAVLPLAAVYKGLLEFLPTIVVFAGVYLALGEPLQRSLLWLPVLFGIQLVMGVGLALLTSTAVVFFRDAENVLTYVQRILFFTTPVIYPVTMLPDEIRSALAYQPFFPLFATYQHVLGGEPADLALVGLAAAWATGFLVVGAWVFVRHEHQMASRL